MSLKAKDIFHITTLHQMHERPPILNNDNCLLLLALSIEI